MDLLRMHQIEVLVDVRSQPYSKYAPHFAAPSLKPAIKAADLKYLFLGRELGGRPQEHHFYDAAGHVLYDQVAQTPLFLNGITRLEQGIQTYRVALMCAEENPNHCHRRLLVSRVLAERGIAVWHIRGDGSMQAEEELAAAERQGTHDNGQLPLFDRQEVTPWRSIQSGLQKKQLPNSSDS